MLFSWCCHFFVFFFLPFLWWRKVVSPIFSFTFYVSSLLFPCCTDMALSLSFPLTPFHSTVEALDPFLPTSLSSLPPNTMEALNPCLPLSLPPGVLWKNFTSLLSLLSTLSLFSPSFPLSFFLYSPVLTCDSRRGRRCVPPWRSK